MRPHDRWLPLPAAALGLLLLGATAPEFRGCAGDDPLPPEGVPLPRADGGACVLDSECPADGCMDVRCLAGSCVAVAPLVDRDGDGVSPAPCGDDCDDTDPAVLPGARERCDGRDNDCNDLVDDGAPRLDAVYGLAGGDSLSTLVGWGSAFLYTERTTGVLWGIPTALDGVPGRSIELMRLTMGSAFARVAGATAADGRTLVVTVTDFGAARYVIVEPDGSGARVLEGPAAMPLPPELGTLENLEVIPFGAGWAIGYDGMGATSAVRHASLAPSAPPAITLPLTGTDSSVFASFGFATDGTHLALSDGPRVTFFLPDGSAVATHELVSGLTAARPLASYEGAVGVVFPDAFDHRLGLLRAADGFGGPTPGECPSCEAAPFGDPGDLIRFARAGDLFLLARAGAARTTVQALQDDLFTYEGSPLVFELGLGPSARVTFASVGGSAAALASYASGGVGFGVLRGCAGP